MDHLSTISFFNCIACGADIAIYPQTRRILDSGLCLSAPVLQWFCTTYAPAHEQSQRTSYTNFKRQLVK